MDRRIVAVDPAMGDSYTAVTLWESTGDYVDRLQQLPEAAYRALFEPDWSTIPPPDDRANLSGRAIETRMRYEGGRQHGRTDGTIQKLTSMVNIQAGELRKLRGENEDLRRRLAEAESAAGWSHDNSPALGGLAAPNTGEPEEQP